MEAQILTSEEIKAIEEVKPLLDKEEETLEDSFTLEKVKDFLKGEISWAELEGMSMEEAYAIAEIGHTFIEQGKYKEALTIFEGLNAANPYDGYFHACLGLIHQRLKKTDEALIHYTLAIQIDPEDLDSLANRAEILIQKGKFTEAQEDLLKIKELDPKGETISAKKAKLLQKIIAKEQSS